MFRLDSFSVKYFRKCHYSHAQIDTPDAADRRRFPVGSSPVEQISSRASGNAPRVASYFSSHNFSWPFYPSRLHLSLSLFLLFSLLFLSYLRLVVDTHLSYRSTRSTSSVLFHRRFSLSFSPFLSCQNILRTLFVSRRCRSTKYASLRRE